MTKQRKGDWMQTVTGRQFWPIDPRPDEVFIEDIAHALSMMCRFNGHCERFYSVAEHSVLVSFAVPESDALWGLLHDAPEAYIADIVKPAKPYISGYAEAESNLMKAVCDKFGLSRDMPSSVKKADCAVLADEAEQIMGPHPFDWNLPFPPSGQKVIGWSPARAKEMFLMRYEEIMEAQAQSETIRV